MSSDWGFSWNVEAERTAGVLPDAATIAASLPPRKGRHRRSNSTPLESTSSQLLTAAPDNRANEEDEPAFGTQGDFLQDVLNGPTLTKTRSERLRSRGGARATRRGAMHAAARQHSLAQRVSGRMTKGRGKLGVLHEGYGSTDEEEDSGDDAYGQVMGKGGKVKRVLANRQSAQRSRIRKLQHITELEATLEALQDDIFKLNPQLTKLEAKQAGLDDENQELQHKLAALKVESRQKDAVTQSLSQEVSDLRQKQEEGHIGQQQRNQQQSYGKIPSMLPTRSQHHRSAYALTSQDTYTQQPFGSPQSNVAQQYPLYPQTQPQIPDMGQSQTVGQRQAQGQSQPIDQFHHQSTAAQPDTDIDPDNDKFVERLMQRYQYDQAQARHRQQQVSQQQQQYKQHQQQQQQQQHRPVQDRSQQQSQRGLDMLAELQQIPPSFQNRSASQGSDEAQAYARWRNNQAEPGQHPSHEFSRQGGHDSFEGCALPQLIYSNGFPTGDHQYMLSQQLDSPSQLGFQSRQHSLDADMSQWAMHNRTDLHQSFADHPQALSQDQDGIARGHKPTFQPQRHSCDGSRFMTQPQGQSSDQQQLLYRSRSLTLSSQQAALQRQEAKGLPSQHPSMFQRPQSAGGESSGAVDAVGRLQKHSNGQTCQESPMFVPQQLPFQQPQHHAQNPQPSWSYAQSGSQYTHNPQMQGLAQPQRQFPAGPQNRAWEVGEGLYQIGLPKQKSSGDMSRHGSGSTEGPLAEYVPQDSLLRGSDSMSNASSEQSERSLSSAQRAVMGSYLRGEGQTTMLNVPAEYVKHAAWAKGMPPSGKKKRDNSQHRAALSRLT